MRLPKELWIIILNNVDDKTVIKVIRVCKLFKNIITDKHFWKIKYPVHFKLSFDYQIIYDQIKFISQIENSFSNQISIENNYDHEYVYVDGNSIILQNNIRKREYNFNL